MDREERRQIEVEGGENARLIDVFARRETPVARARRIARKTITPETAQALRRLWAN